MPGQRRLLQRFRDGVVMLEQAHALYAALGRHPLTADRRTRSFIRAISWQLRSRFGSEHVMPWVNETRLVLRRGMTGATGNLYFGLHDFSEMSFLLHLLRPEDLFLDVGANVGSYTVLASGATGARTMAFEPDVGAAAAFDRNMAANGIGSRVALVRAAVSDAAGLLPFTTGLGPTNHVADSGSMVASTTIDLATKTVPTLIKVDVEGHDAQAIKGAARTLADSRLKALIVEDRRASPLLIGAGLVEVGYDPIRRALTPPGPGNNTMFIRDVEFVEARLRSAPPYRLGRNRV